MFHAVMDVRMPEARVYISLFVALEKKNAGFTNRVMRTLDENCKPIYVWLLLVILPKSDVKEVSLDRRFSLPLSSADSDSLKLNLEYFLYVSNRVQFNRYES
ncbi:unnamed protein product [Onchocerca flexuosa]|uniref:Uncharacterized protein n=1 Tax=Onchocerca flexuosa TaxID=387005 RepID=A0A183HRY0_9BILA|nr:unnamed protein product [Onchocerca flexuosa]